MKKKPVRLYNVLFPIWAIYLVPSVVPTLWLILLPANFLMDSLVLLLGAKALKLCTEAAEPQPLFRLWKRRILPVWLFGFLSDFIGTGVVFAVYKAVGTFASGLDVMHFPGTTLISIPGVLAAGVLIYVLNRFITFQKSGLSPVDGHRLSLVLALFTAPYTMMLPLYG